MAEPAGPSHRLAVGEASAPMAPPAVRGGRRMWMTALLLAVLMGTLDSGMLNLAFRELVDDFASSLTVVAWVALAYLIAAAAPMWSMTRVAAAIGNARSFRIGVALYGVMTVLCGMAPDVGTLIALRALQGLGMAMFVPPAIVLAAAAYPPERRARALAILAVGGAIGLIVGPPVGGWLLDVYGWRSIFLARLPLVVLAIALALWVVRREPTGRSPGPDRRELDNPEDLEPGQRRAAFARASLASIAVFASLAVCFFMLPIVMLGGAETSARNLGLMLGSIALIAALVSPQARKWSDRLGPERFGIAGAIGVGLGNLALLLVHPRAPLWQFMLPMVLIGVGSGLFLAPNRSLLMKGVPPHRLAMADGLVGTVRLGGHALGFAIMAGLITLMQNRLEYVWSGRAAAVMPQAEALRYEQLFQRGGIWSADLLTLALHVGVLVAAAMLLFAVMYSIRGSSLRLRDHLLAAAAAIAFAGLAIPALLGRSNVVGTGATVSGPPAVAQSAVAPFGMASRQRIELQAAAGTQGDSGAGIFAGLCAACHGQDGRGLPPPQGFGIDLTTSRFIAEAPDSALADFIRKGRSIDDPQNTTGMPMPPMAGVIPDDRIELVVQHLRRIRR